MFERLTRLKTKLSRFSYASQFAELGAALPD